MKKSRETLADQEKGITRKALLDALESAQEEAARANRTVEYIEFVLDLPIYKRRQVHRYVKNLLATSRDRARLRYH